MRKRWILGGGALALAFAVAYLGSPFLAIRDLKAAALSGEADRIEKKVDFPAVRESFKSQANAAMIANMKNDPEMADNPFAGLGIMLAPVIVDKMVDAYVTPDGLAAIIKNGRLAEPGAESDKRAENIEYSSHYTDLDRFRVDIRSKEVEKTPVGLLFERRGLFSWKLVRLYLPIDELTNEPAS
ncbi:DUF2939 domain-containing protein [Hephaestia sp. GCM10023244]|uniref:DUF2939 domain-containing protein n=1 Tax=unclassified Hephaestia TaxID=2631281 RepID=UPI0020771FB5|nr:DUF2939 domain-containing protein [Hephaestia sp. MAHUQ-44]MCM8731425.1 DUF2939 domain-containing protein [Hephaestia sp. MAHUQ-44]